MSYNVFLGGAGLSLPLSKSAEVIEAGGADIVGIQENQGQAGALAGLLGFHYAYLEPSAATQDKVTAAVLSRHPITERFTHGVQITVGPGTEVYLFNVHLPGFPYQPYDIRDGRIADETQAIAEAWAARGAGLAAALAELSAVVPPGAPLFLTGDFNEPSHLDWTEAAAAAGIHAIEVAWPASNAVAGVGLTDAYRAIHANEVERPGNTWTPAPGAFGPAETEIHDRIDFVYFAGERVRLLDVHVVGESDAQADIVVRPYPSDHRAVVAAFTLMPSLPASGDRETWGNGYDRVTFSVPHPDQPPSGMARPLGDALPFGSPLNLSLNGSNQN